MTDDNRVPYYGPRPQSLLHRLVGLIIFLALVAIYVWANVQPKKDCSTLASDEIETYERDGKKIGRLRLDRIPPGECVIIRPSLNTAP